jgi:hypothetical protein
LICISFNGCPAEPIYAALKIGSAGQPLKDMQIKIVDELGQESSAVHFSG